MARLASLRSTSLTCWMASLLTCGATSLNAPATELPSPGVPQSCGVQLKTHNFSAEVLDQVHALGFRCVRRGFYWSSIEKEKGGYDFSDYDGPMQHARQVGMTVIGVLFGGNDLYEPAGRRGIQTETGRAGFAAFAAALAAHYREYDVLWEIWNEPNTRTFWRKSGQHNSAEFAAEYTALVRATASAMLKADPECFVMAGSVSNYWEPSFEWTASCFQRGILKSGIRAWSVHPYGVKTPEEFAVGHDRMRDLLRQHGAAQMPLVDTERGFAVEAAAEGWSGGSRERAREFQAWNLVRQFLLDLANGVPLTIWYEWDGDEFGLVGSESPSPAMTACRTMLAQLQGCHFVRRLESDSDRDYVLLFANEASEGKLVAWTAPPPGGAPDEAGEHVVGVRMGTSLSAANLTGEAQTLAAVVPLRLTGAPQYVALPKGADPGNCVTFGTFGQPEAPTSAAVPEGSVNLNLFEPGVQWTFLKNTGRGTFELGTDDAGKPVGTLHYDFTQSRSQSTPYVLASCRVQIAAGARAVTLLARSPLVQQLTFRLVDQTGQTFQFKKRIKGTRAWEAITIPLTRRLEHWGGVNDGTPHFPLKQMVLSLPLPDADHKTGKVEYADIAVLGTGVTAPPTATMAPAASEQNAPPAALTGPTDLKLFTGQTKWLFEKNTGAGAFELGQDEAGNPVGILHYDFTKSRSKSTPYVLATGSVNIPPGASEVTVTARSPLAQKLTFRVVDQTGQTLQFKGKVKGSGDWEIIRIPLTRRLEHWDGANDGTPHFPLTRIVFCVPLPDEEHKTGKVEYREVVAR